MKYFVDVDGKVLEVELVERLGELEVRLDGRAIDVDYREADRLGQVALGMDGLSFAVSIEGGAHRCTVNVAGQLHSVEIEDERERAAHAADGGRRGSGEVKSVMPGVVLKLLTAVGDTVEKGQALLILEAMKMQNEIAAPCSGEVAVIRVEEGQAVSSGTLLVVLKPAPQDAPAS